MACMFWGYIQNYMGNTYCTLNILTNTFVLSNYVICL